MIPEAALEVAARAIDASESTGCGCCSFPKFTDADEKRADELGVNVRSLLIAREVLEATAPIMLSHEREQDQLRHIPTYANCATCDGGGCGDCV